MGIILFSGCSVTKHLPEGEVLYTGGKTVIQNKSTTSVGGTALTEIEAALDKTPSTKMLGGLLPIPFKMWMYNDFVKYKKGFGKWMFNRLAVIYPVFPGRRHLWNGRRVHSLFHDYGALCDCAGL